LGESAFISTDIIDYLRNTIEENDKLKEILNAIQQPPKKYTVRINLTKTTSNKLLEYYIKNEPNFNITTGVLDNILDFPVQGPYKFDLLKKKVFADKFASESVMMGADLFVPGVKNVPKFEKDDEISVLLSPTEKKYDIEDPKIYHVSNGIAEISSRDLVKQRKGILIRNMESKYKTVPYRHSEMYQQGLISDQNFPAILATTIFMDSIISDIKLKKNDNPLIFDTCSAPGHKSTALSEIGYHFMQTKLGKKKWLEIVSIDRSKNRLKHLETDILRLGLQNITVLPVHLEKIAKKHPNLIGKANHLFFDPPCSALGTRPKLYLDKNKADLETYSINQTRLFKYVDNLLQSGGLLMYNTCTIPKEENEEVILYALEKLGYQLISIPDEYSKLGHPAIAHENLSITDSRKMLRFYPKISESMGYFIALLRKT
jgi:16S rRNA C967 or C1407 C5-methylase (RsmB/RsmF family)